MGRFAERLLGGAGTPCCGGSRRIWLAAGRAETETMVQRWLLLRQWRCKSKRCDSRHIFPNSADAASLCPISILEHGEQSGSIWCGQRDSSIAAHLAQRTACAQASERNRSLVFGRRRVPAAHFRIYGPSCKWT